MLDRTDAVKLVTRIRRQWFAKRKSVAAILKEVMTNDRRPASIFRGLRAAARPPTNHWAEPEALWIGCGLNGG